MGKNRSRYEIREEPEIVWPEGKLALQARLRNMLREDQGPTGLIPMILTLASPGPAAGELLAILATRHLFIRHHLEGRWQRCLNYEGVPVPMWLRRWIDNERQEPKRKRIYTEELGGKSGPAPNWNRMLRIAFVCCAVEAQGFSELETKHIVADWKAAEDPEPDWTREVNRVNERVVKPLNRAARTARKEWRANRSSTALEDQPNGCFG